MSYELSSTSFRRINCHRFTVVFFLTVSLLIGCDNRTAKFERLTAEGEAHYAAREYREALRDWTEAARLLPGDGGAHERIGKAYLKLAGLSQAISEYKEASLLVPEREDIRMGLAALLLLSGDLAAAEPLILDIAEKYPKSSESHRLMGDFEMLMNRSSSAEASYRLAATLPGGINISLVRLAISLWAQHRVEEANGIYQRVETVGASDVDTLLQMYQYMRLAGDIPQAEALLRKAMALEPEDLSLSFQMVALFMAENRLGEAQSALETLSAQLPDPLPARKRIIEILFLQNRMKEAETLLEKLPGTEAKDPELAMLRGKYHLLAGEYVPAVGYFKGALQLFPKNPLADYLMGVSLLLNGQIHLARKSLTEALSLDPFFTDAELLLADVYYIQKEYDFAAEHAHRIMEREPENWRAYLILGNIRSAQGRTETALTALAKAECLYPDVSIPLYPMAVAAEQDQRYEAALAWYRKAVAACPERIDASLRYAELLMRTGKLSEARGFARAMVAERPKDGLASYLLGEVERAAGYRKEAIAAYGTAVRYEPKLAAAYLRLAALFSEGSDPVRQREVLSVCIEENPGTTQAYLMLADVSRRELDLVAAEKILVEGLSKNPGEPWLSANLAWIYLEQDKELTQALALARTAYETLPDEPSVCDTLGWACCKKGLLSQAVPILMEAVKKAPKNALVRYHLGRAYLAAQKMPDAESALRRSLDLGLEDPLREEAEGMVVRITEDPGAGDVVDIPFGTGK